MLVQRRCCGVELGGGLHKPASATQPTNRRTSGNKLTTIASQHTPLTVLALIDRGVRQTIIPDLEYLHQLFGQRERKSTYSTSTTTPTTNSIHSSRSHARPRRHATSAARRPGPQLRARSLHRLHALERNLDRFRFTITHRRRALRVYGTRVPKRGSVVLME